ncbi:MAG: hypothetical protein Q7S02_02965 [bacterium]|nr:hypothetical protein [bacterium]
MRSTFAGIISASIIALVSVTAEANPTLFSVEPQMYVVDLAGVDPSLVREVEVLVLHDIADPFGVYSFALVNEGWAQGQFGATMWLTTGLQLGIGAAIEQDPTPYRGAAFLAVTPDLLANVSALVVGEYGGSGAFFTVNGGYHVAEWLRIGVMAERYEGLGPRLDFFITGTPVKVWTTVGHDFEANTWNGVISVGFDCVNTGFCSE